MQNDDAIPVTPYDPSCERRMLAALVGVCSLTIAAGAALSAMTPQAAPSPFTLGNVADAQLVEIRDRSGETRLSGEFRSSVDAIGNTEKDAALMNVRDRMVIGEVELEIPARGRSDRRPELEVDILGLAPRAAYSVFIDDRLVATFTTDDRGSVDMELQEGERAAAQQPR
jgi:hypothetical protein